MKVKQKEACKIKGLPILESPSHIVVETDKELIIDRFPVNFILEDSVKTKQLSKKCVEVIILFLAKSYELKKEI